MPKPCKIDECERDAHARGWCKLHYERNRRNGSPHRAIRKHNPCGAEGCTKLARSRSATLCPMHYHRLYRHGSTETVSSAGVVSVSNGRRYKTKYRPHHPLASKRGIVYEHRMVLYDAIGEGPHPCHYCGIELNWVARGEPGELQPDHVNNMGDDNRIENLVPCCRSCNTARAQQARHEALVQRGWWSANDTISRLKTGRAPRIDSGHGLAA